MISAVDILGIGVHPDDVELGCIGTLAVHKDLGYSFGIVDLTRGELGSRGSVSIRDAEAEASAKISGADFRVNLDMRDGFFEITEANLLKLVVAIRSARPDIVLANAIKDRHPDHGRAAKLISRACFLAGLQRIKTIDNQEVEQLPHRPKRVYHYIQDYNLVPDLVIDITDHIDTKLNAILAFGSQFYDPNSIEQNTPISSKAFLDFIKAKARVYGRHIDAEFGEGFTCETPVRLNNLFDSIPPL